MLNVPVRTVRIAYFLNKWLTSLKCKQANSEIEVILGVVPSPLRRQGYVIEQLCSQFTKPSALETLNYLLVYILSWPK